MREVTFRVTENSQIADSVFRMTLEGDTSDITSPGQFVNIKLANHYLRRPISVCDWQENMLVVIYKVVGSGTLDMSRLKAGETLSLLSGLGNGYDISDSENARAVSLRPVIVGGGVGVPPLYGLAKRLLAKNVNPEVILGFNTSADSFLIDEFTALGLRVSVTTLDGSSGLRGLVTDALKDHGYAYCCGPLGMLRAVHARVRDGQFSFESRMACGFGACMCCSVRTLGGSKRVCRDGPVFKHSEIMWDGEESHD